MKVSRTTACQRSYVSQCKTLFLYISAFFHCGPPEILQAHLYTGKTLRPTFIQGKHSRPTFIQGNTPGPPLYRENTPGPPLYRKTLRANLYTGRTLQPHLYTGKHSGPWNPMHRLDSTLIGSVPYLRHQT